MKEVTIEQRFTFRKKEKLKSRKLIEAVFKKGVSFSNFPFRILYFFQPENVAHLQAGFAVSTKNFKKAVERNRIKRVMREAFRLQKSDLTATLELRGKYMAVFFIYTGNQLPEYKVVAEGIGTALKKLIRITDEAAAADI